MDYNQMSLKMHEENHGKLEVVSKVAINDRDDLSTAYTPGVAEPCRKIHANPADVYKYTCKANTVAVVSDGTAVLGLGDIGPEAAIPVMEGKSVLSKGSLRVETYGTIDEVDSVLGSARAFVVHQNVKETIFKIQKDLWLLMADVASLGKEPNIGSDHVKDLEQTIDKYTEELEPLDHFLVPGETQGAAFLDVARAVVRRAERSMWRLSETEEVHESGIRYQIGRAHV